MIIPSFHTEQLKEGEGDVIWTIYLKNGDTLRLHHTVKITRIPVATLTENDYPMATVDDLNVLLDTLAHEADRKSVYILQLPAVIYEGGLTMKNFCCDLIGSESGTTFTGTVTIATRGIHPSNITNVRFVGDGTGIGLSASEGAFLHCCTFENWEIGAYGGQRHGLHISRQRRGAVTRQPRRRDVLGQLLWRQRVRRQRHRRAHRRNAGHGDAGFQ